MSLDLVLGLVVLALLIGVAYYRTKAAGLQATSDAETAQNERANAEFAAAQEAERAAFEARAKAVVSAGDRDAAIKLLHDAFGGGA